MFSPYNLLSPSSQETRKAARRLLQQAGGAGCDDSSSSDRQEVGEESGGCDENRANAISGRSPPRSTCGSLLAVEDARTPNPARRNKAKSSSSSKSSRNSRPSSRRRRSGKKKDGSGVGAAGGSYDASDDGDDDGSCPPPQLDVGSWRTTPESGNDRSRPLSLGIPPSIFHAFGSTSRGNEKDEDEEEQEPRAYPTADVGASTADATDGATKKTVGTTGRTTPRYRRRRSRSASSSKQKTATKPGMDVVVNMRGRILEQQKMQLMQHLEWKRSAFKSVTSLKKFPIQERAMQFYRQLLPTLAATAAGCGSSQQAGAATAPGSSQKESASSSSSSSSSSALSSILPNNEPKRMLRNLFQSPAKSRLKAQYLEEFKQQSAATAGIRNQQKGHAGTNNRNSGDERQQLDASGDEPRQDEMQHAQAALWSQVPRIFSSEISDTGKRRYWVGHLGRFMDKYWRKTEIRDRHYYELIVENTPCRLYLDLEFNKEANGKITDEVAEALLNELFEELALQFQKVHCCDILRSDVIDLDSSTATKFSRHWIVHTKPRIFASTAALGQFVKDWIMTDLAARHGSEELGKTRPLLQQYLFVNNASDSKSSGGAPNNNMACFIDLGVYTKNRLFRLLGSSKFGKPPTAALRIAEANEFPLPITNADFYLPAMEQKQQSQEGTGAIADTVDGVDDNLDCVMRKFITATDWTLHAEALAQTLVVPPNVDEFETFPYDEDKVVLNRGRIATGASAVGKPSTGQPASRPVSVYGSSPYPVLDNFVTYVLGARGGSSGEGTVMQGAIRAWSIDRRNEHGVPTRMSYQMCRNRYCENIGRHHKSNNVMWIVDLELYQCVQGCHDPDCRAMQFRGTPVPLPPDVQQAVSEALFEEALAVMDEEALLLSQPTARKSIAKCDVDVGEALAALQIDDSKTKGPSEMPSSRLSDDDLMAAVLANPDLFP